MSVSIHTQVFDEARILPVVSVASKLIDDDFANAQCDLVSRPPFHRRRCESRAVEDDPARKIAHGGKIAGKFSPKGFRESPSRVSESKKQGDCDPNPLAFPLRRQNRRDCQSTKQRSDEQKPCQQWWAIELQLRRRSGVLNNGTKGSCAAFARKKASHRSIGRHASPCCSAVLHERLSQAVEGTMCQANISAHASDLLCDEFNQVSWRANLLRFGVFDANVEPLFDTHNNLDAVQTHAAICAAGVYERQALRGDA